MCYLSVCRFRRQHDQLRQVIVKVLRPTTAVTAARPGSPAGDATDKLEPALDVADANAIEVDTSGGTTVDYNRWLIETSLNQTLDCAMHHW